MAETTKTKTTKTKKSAPKAKAAGKKTCTVAGCKRAYRAKGLCFFHYKKWRRGELEGRPTRWIGVCSKAECKKKVAEHGLCQEHFEAWKKSRKKNQAKAAAEAAPAA
ncbi:MAG: hypothetical protein U0229_21075 [Anaeromyxobacter sp.]